MIETSSILLRMKKFSYKSRTENQPNKHFMFNKVFSENRAFYEVMWKNLVQ